MGKVVWRNVVFGSTSKKDLRRRPDVAFVSHARWPFNRRVPKVIPVGTWFPIWPSKSSARATPPMKSWRRFTTICRPACHACGSVYPEQAEVYHLFLAQRKSRWSEIGQELDGGDLLPGFRLPVAVLFEDDPE